MKFEKNTELDQANLRLIVATCAILYVVLIGLLPGLKVGTTCRSLPTTACS